MSELAIWRESRNAPEARSVSQNLLPKHDRYCERWELLRRWKCDEHTAKVNREGPSLLHQVVSEIGGRVSTRAGRLVRENDGGSQIDFSSEN